MLTICSAIIFCLSAFCHIGTTAQKLWYCPVLKALHSSQKVLGKLWPQHLHKILKLQRPLLVTRFLCPTDKTYDQKFPLSWISLILSILPSLRLTLLPSWVVWSLAHQSHPYIILVDGRFGVDARHPLSRLRSVAFHQKLAHCGSLPEHGYFLNLFAIKLKRHLACNKFLRAFCCVTPSHPRKRLTALLGSMQSAGTCLNKAPLPSYWPLSLMSRLFTNWKYP